jgi:hypothetical protein
MVSRLEELCTGCLGLRQAPVVAPRIGASSSGEITRSLDMAQERLDAVEKHLARLAPHTPSAEPDEQELREIQLLVAQQAADLLGAEHPLVAHLQGARLHRPVAAITDQRPHF